MLQVGERIDEWIVEGSLGAGGTASVYRCRNGNADRIVAALKVLDVGALVQAGARERLAREGEVLHGLEHPGIVRVHGVRPGSAPPYLVMELIEGDKLSTRLTQAGAMPLEKAEALLEKLADAVAYLHQKGIQHRDIKPQNILLSDGDQPILVDFGLVLESGASRLTADGLRMGTVSYVPPEWADPTAIDPVKWDVYSLGTVFWEVLVGRRAFPLPDDTDPSTGALQVMAEKRRHPPLDPGPDVPFYLRLLIRDMTHPDPRERPADAGAVLARLRAREDGAIVDPVELFRTPMPAWQQQPTSAPTLDNLATSGVPSAPPDMAVASDTPNWVRSFISGALVGGVVVAFLFAVFVAWWWFTQTSSGAVREIPVTVEPAEPRPAPVPVPAELPEPEPALEPDPAEVPAAPVVEEPAAVAPDEGPVSAAAFAAWVAQNPDWSATSAVELGKADAGYLKGWDAGVPGGPATRVSWYAASAYCESRGGLAGVTDAPTRWEGKPYMEWREADGRPAWRGHDGRDSTTVDPASTPLTHGFRCRR